MEQESMGNRSKIPGRLFFNLFLILFATIVIISAFDLGLGTLESPGPGIFPLFCSSLIIVLNILILVFEKKSRDNDSLFNQFGKKNFLLMIIPFFCWLLLINIFGYILITLITTYSFSKIAGLEGWIKPLILSLGISAFCYFLFDIYLYLDLPRGLLG